MEEPKLSDYGLTEQQCQLVKTRKTQLSCVLFFIGILLGGTVAYIAREDDALVALFIVAWSGVIFAALVTPILRAFWPLYKRVENFKNKKSAYESWLIRTQQEFWLSLSGKRFEQELAYLYSKLGYKIQLTPTTADKGIDIILKKNGKTIVVQCKAHKKPVSPHVVRDLYGTLVDSQADEAILASISGFTSGVKDFVVDKPIGLISLEDIIYIQKKLSLDKDNAG